MQSCHWWYPTTTSLHSPLSAVELARRPGPVPLRILKAESPNNNFSSFSHYCSNSLLISFQNFPFILGPFLTLLFIRKTFLAFLGIPFHLGWSTYVGMHNVTYKPVWMQPKVHRPLLGKMEAQWTVFSAFRAERLQLQTMNWFDFDFLVHFTFISPWVHFNSFCEETATLNGTEIQSRLAYRESSSSGEC
jgi:hypothetical protein